MRIAIVGSGISGLYCALRLHQHHDVTLFEQDHRPGGHTHTTDVDLPEGRIPVDTGFIVFNPPNYPLLTAMFRELHVESAPTTMSFSVTCERTGIEYGGRSPSSLFARRRNALSPAHWAMLRDIRRFARHALDLLADPSADPDLDDWLASLPLSRAFRDRYLIPMGSAIWSAPTASMARFPARTFARFFHNHGMLTPWNAPRWRFVKGGSRTYVQRIRQRLGDRVRLASPVRAVARAPFAVTLTTDDDQTHQFDEVIIAAHSDQALAMLADPSPAERQVLGSIAYQPNDAVLHTDASLLPRRRAAWSAWNYRLGADPDAPPTVTYYMNALQALPTSTPVCVTLNDTARIDPDRIISRTRYDHPVFDRAAIAAQQRWHEVSGVNRTHYCGAYWYYGFHEDGARSAQRVCDAIGVPA